MHHAPAFPYSASMLVQATNEISRIASFSENLCFIGQN